MISTVQARHITQLRTAIDELRVRLGMSAFSWQTHATTSDWITADPVLEMRTALDQALGAPPSGYSAGLAQNQPIKAIHIQELRDRLLAAWGIDIRWLVTDQLGTPRMVFDQSGSLSGVSRHDYLPFGEELFAGTGGRTATQGYSIGDGARQKFTLKERDIETGLDYFEARYYASMQGRFTSVDALLSSGVPGEPQSWNRYSYTINNPLKFTDPSGLIWVYQDSPGIRTFRWYDDEKDVPKGWTAFTESYYDGADGRYYFNPEGPKGYFEGPSQRNGLFAINIDPYDVRGWIKGPTPEQYQRYMASGAVEDETWDIIALLIPGKISKEAIGASVTARAEREALEAIPRAANPALQRTIDALFQTTDRLPGGTAGAIRHELETGELVGGRSHLMKGADRIRNLERIMRREKLSPADRATAQRLLHDLQDALKGK